jgi:hypothetical protein
MAENLDFLVRRTTSKWSKNEKRALQKYFRESTHVGIAVFVQWLLFFSVQFEVQLTIVKCSPFLFKLLRRMDG